MADNTDPWKSKIVETVRTGIGGLFGPWSHKRLVGAKADEIRLIAAAVTDAQGMGADVKYESGGVIVTPTVPKGDDETDRRALAEQTLARIAYQEAKRQINLEQVAQHALNEASPDVEPSVDRVDEDWIARFFNTAQDVSSEQMQHLWGRILAGEVRQPGTFSLRTLDVARNLTRSDAKLFESLARALFEAGGLHILIDPKTEGYLSDQFGIAYSDLLLLEQCGLLQLASFLSMKVLERDRITFVYGKTAVEFKPAEGKQLPESLSVHGLLTEAGKQLVKFIKIEPNERHLQELALYFKGVAAPPIYGEWRLIDDQHIEIVNSRILPAFDNFNDDLPGPNASHL